ncbi:MAG: hypothetical protein WAS21_27420 [Geminicoccaceae bacterium]
MLSIHELGTVTRAMPPMRRVLRQSGGVRVVGARIVPRSVAVARSQFGPTRSRILVEYAAALLYGVPFYGACCLALARASLRRRQQQAARRQMDYSAAGVRADNSGRGMSS